MVTAGSPSKLVNPAGIGGRALAVVGATIVVLVVAEAPDVVGGFVLEVAFGEAHLVSGADREIGREDARILDNQREGDDAVAAGSIGNGLHIITSLGIGVAVPGEGARGNDSGVVVGAAAGHCIGIIILRQTYIVLVAAVVRGLDDVAASNSETIGSARAAAGGGPVVTYRKK